MDTENLKKEFCITASSWNKSSQDSKNEFIQLLKTDVAGARNFSRLYFEKFLLIHEIGHVIQDIYSQKGESNQTEAEKEYYANVFALKYFQYKKEERYLIDIFKWFDYLLDAYNVKIVFHLDSIDKMLEKYKKDRRTYGALQFVLVKEAQNNKMSLQKIVEKISVGELTTLNSSIILRKGLIGNELVSECLELIFSMNEFYPRVEVEYGQSLGFQTLERIF